MKGAGMWHRAAYVRYSVTLLCFSPGFAELGLNVLNPSSLLVQQFRVGSSPGARGARPGLAVQRSPAAGGSPRQECGMGWRSSLLVSHPVAGVMQGAP